MRNLLLALGLAALGMTAATCTPRPANGQFECTPGDSDSCPGGLVCLPLGVEHRCFHDFQSTCGNHVLEPGEQCDGSSLPDGACAALGYPVGTASCLATCRIFCTACGNGVPDPGEACDDGTLNSDAPGAACRPDCKPRRCGDGILDPGEVCDEGELNADLADALCRTDCTRSRCGDGVVDEVEECDDGGLEAGDGCSPACTTEAGWMCVGDAPSYCQSASFVTLQPGTFTMGAPTDEVNYSFHEKLHQVTLTRAFEIQRTEVTQAQFGALMGYNPSFDTGCGPRCPVESVTWHEAAAYCNRLSILTGLDPCYSCAGGAADLLCDLKGDLDSPYDCEGYRLPTAAEWEYAARAGTTANTYNGQMLGYWCEPDGVLDPIAWFCGNSRAEGPREVATRAANPWGLFDVLGNVAEWNHDWLPPSTPTDAVDPWGPATGTNRLSRGGSAYTQTMFARAASITYSAPGARYKWHGFRIARTR